MEKSKHERGINLCNCKDTNTVISYCNRCKMYICSDCQVTSHIDHDTDVVDLAEKCTGLLAEFQKLYRVASLICDRRQVHIKDESIEKIVEEIRGKFLLCSDSLQKDINKSTESSISYMAKSPLIQELAKRKVELSQQTEDPLLNIKQELDKICKELLQEISNSKLVTADKLVSMEKLKEYEEKIKTLTDNSSKDLDFIQEIRKLKQTKVNYSYNPMSILGMIKVTSQIKKPNRIFQFDREQNMLNIYNIDTGKLSMTKLNLSFILPFRFVSVEVGDNLYLSGGDNDNNVYLKSLYCYDELIGNLLQLSEMKEGRCRHCLVGMQDEQNEYKIYAIGGESDKGVLKSCEVYNTKEDSWKEAPKLTEGRCGASAVLTGKKYIYIIGGFTEDYIGSCERLEITEEGKWETVKVRKEPIKPVLSPGLALLKDDLMLIYGGYNKNEELSADCYILDSKNNTNYIKKIKLQEKDSFISSESKVFDGKLYSFGYTKGGIHIYDIEKEAWNYIKQENIQTI